MGMYKKVVGGAREMQAVMIDSLVVDAVPRVNSMNFVTSDAVARAVAGASGEVPQVTEQDNGKVLKAVYDEGGPAVEWGDASQAPAYNPAVYDYGSDASDFMTALLANWSAGKPMMLRVPVSEFSTLTSGRQFWRGGYLFLPLVSFTSTGLTQTAIFALTDGLEVFSAKFVIDEDEPAWDGVHTDIDQ